MQKLVKNTTLEYESDDDYMHVRVINRSFHRHAVTAQKCSALLTDCWSKKIKQISHAL